MFGSFYDKHKNVETWHICSWKAPPSARAPAPFCWFLLGPRRLFPSCHIANLKLLISSLYAKLQEAEIIYKVDAVSWHAVSGFVNRPLFCLHHSPPGTLRIGLSPLLFMLSEWKGGVSRVRDCWVENRQYLRSMVDITAGSRISFAHMNTDTEALGQCKD